MLQVFRGLACLGLLAVSFYLSLAWLQAHSPPVPEKKIPQAAVTSQTKNVPTIQSPARLEISSINIDAKVKPVGVTDEGNMAIDDSIVDVAWYKDGPKPGEKGSAVISGHYGWKDGVPSVFNEIHTLQKGDKISVFDEQGSRMIFITQRIQKYDPKADTADVFLSHDGKSHLNLITCDGSWNSALNSYTERLVVFADREV